MRNLVLTPDPCSLNPSAVGATPLNPAAAGGSAHGPIGATGPRTAEGKAISSRNAVKHNLTSTRLTGSDLQEFEAIRATLAEEWQPAAGTEAMLIEQMALSKWRIERALSLELTAFHDNELNERMLALAIRYRTSAEREFHKSLNDLTRLRAANKKSADRREKFELQAAAIRAKYSSPDPSSLSSAPSALAPAAEGAPFVSRADYHFSEEGMRAFFRQQMAKMDAEVLAECGRSTGD